MTYDIIIWPCYPITLNLLRSKLFLRKMSKNRVFRSQLRLISWTWIEEFFLWSNL